MEIYPSPINETNWLYSNYHQKEMSKKTRGYGLITEKQLRRSKWRARAKLLDYLESQILVQYALGSNHLHMIEVDKWSLSVLEKAGYEIQDHNHEGRGCFGYTIKWKRND